MPEEPLTKMYERRNLRLGNAGIERWGAPFGIRAHTRCEAAVPGVGVFFPGNDLDTETFDLDRTICDGHVGVDSGLAEIKVKFRIGHLLLS